MQIADFNGDGFYDFAVAYNSGGANGQVQTFLQGASGAFTVQQTFGGSVNAQQMSMGDFNGDGIADLLSSNTTNSTVLLLLGNANGTFSSTTLAAGGTTNQFTVGDFNGDGALDIITRDSPTTLGLFRGVATSVATLERLSLYDRRDSLATLMLLDRVSERITQQRGSLGAFSSRIEVALRALRTGVENAEQAASRITDADIGVEAANAVRARIVSEAAAGILAQANQQPALALQLLGV